LLFDSFDRSGLRLVAGKTSMDIGAPKDVLEPVAQDIESQENLIAKWHGRDGRLFYAITPRFALSCSPAMMKALQALREKYRSCYVQTHISENINEVKDVLAVWKGFRDYLAVYEDHGLLGSKTLLAHGIYLTESELTRVAASGTSIVHCPTSNTFLGSGLFNLNRATTAGAKVCLASDIGAGTGLSPWQTMLECYKVQALQGASVSADELLYRATLAGAEALSLDVKTGSLEVGKYADFVVVRPDKNELLGERLAVTKSSSERLFACIAYGDDRIVDSVYVAGKRLNDSVAWNDLA
jgi:guanine deaminase